MDFLPEYFAKLANWWTIMSPLDRTWLGIGLFGQTMFVMRWFIQWIASERAGQSVVPDLFWYFSLGGGLLVLSYGIYKPEPVLVLGQFGVLIYARNIYLLLKTKRLSDSSAGAIKAGRSTEARRSANPGETDGSKLPAE